jgi:hypothetical protein
MASTAKKMKKKPVKKLVKPSTRSSSKQFESDTAEVNALVRALENHLKEHDVKDEEIQPLKRDQLREEIAAIIQDISKELTTVGKILPPRLREPSNGPPPLSKVNRISRCIRSHLSNSGLPATTCIETTSSNEDSSSLNQATTTCTETTNLNEESSPFNQASHGPLPLSKVNRISRCIRSHLSNSGLPATTPRIETTSSNEDSSSLNQVNSNKESSPFNQASHGPPPLSKVNRISRCIRSHLSSFGLPATTRIEKTSSNEDAANHVHAFEAVCVTVQYQMDKGGEIFAA